MSLEQNYTAILGQLGEDVGREGLLDTPKRAAKAMQYLCRGYQQSLEEVTNGALFSSDNSEMVLVKNIELYSLCEHHLLPFIGKAHVAYIPNGKVLGLSKVASGPRSRQRRRRGRRGGGAGGARRPKFGALVGASEDRGIGLRFRSRWLLGSRRRRGLFRGLGRSGGRAGRS